VNPPLSVVILGCSRNRGWSLERALLSIFDDVSASSLASDASLEIVVVDNGSTDDTVTRLGRLREREPRLRWVTEPTPGISVARNRALAETQADIVVWFDDDVSVVPGWLDAHLNAYRTHPDCDAVGGAITLAFDTRRPWWLGRRLESNLAAFVIEPTTMKRLTRGDALPYGATMSMRREALLVAGRFDEKLGRVDRSLISGEETAMFHHMMDRGHSLWLCGAAQVLHNIPADRTKFRWMAARMYAQGRTDRRMNQRPSALQGVARLFLGGFRYLVAHRDEPTHAAAEYVAQKFYWAGFLAEVRAERRSAR
jgi:glycosyltransferase involved in cell wall biosynthesis